MIIVSLCEKELELCLRLIPEILMKGDAIELRLDYLINIDFKAIQSLIERYPILLTLRSHHEGGATEYSEEMRMQLLKKIIELKPGYLDLEFARDLSLLKYIKKVSPKTKIILSYHNFERFELRIEQKILAMKKYPAWKYKIASVSTSTLDALKMVALMKKHKHFIGIAMGEKGKVSRLLGAVWGQSITYAKWQNQTNHLGQYSISELLDLYRFRRLNSKTKILGLIGSPLAQSPGYRVYNTLFAKYKLDAIYLNFEIEPSELKQFMQYAKELKFHGCSVTIPLKEKVCRFVEKKPINQKNIQAINTLKWRKDELFGMNSDGLGTLALFAKELSIENSRVLIVGAGGTAYGIAYALKEVGAKVLLVNRTESKAISLAKKLKCDCRSFNKLAEVNYTDYDILINATSVGTKNGNEMVLPHKIIYPNKIIVDVALNQTELQKIAIKNGSTLYSGKDLWVEQAYFQFKCWFKVNIPKLKMDLKKQLL